MRRFYRLSAAFLTALVWLACSNAGQAPTGFAGLGPFELINGVISSSTGSFSELNGWNIALVERDSRIARVATVDASGAFTFRHVYTNNAFTMVLLSPSYVVQSVFSFPSSVSTQIEQYFYISSNQLPQIVQQGPIITFLNANGVTFTNDLAPSSAGNGIPDGFNKKLGPNAASTALTALPLKKAYALDNVTVLNDRLPDTDDDGIIDLIDPDVLGAGELNIFNTAANGFVPANNIYFSYGLEWLLARYEISAPTASTFQYAMTFFAQRRSADPAPTAIQILGAPALLANAEVQALTSTGQTVIKTWDGLLEDDGLNYDGLAGDGLFARKLILANSTPPVANQVILFRLAYTDTQDSWTEDYFYTFPPVTPSAISTSYNSATQTVTLIGNPFGTIQNFQWSLSLSQSSEGALTQIYASPLLAGTELTTTIPSNTFTAGFNYVYTVTAQSLDRVPGYAAYTIESPITNAQ